MRCSLAIVALMLAALSGPAPQSALAQSPPRVAKDTKADARTIPRTPDGRPDLQGLWSYRFLTPLEATSTGPLAVSPDDAARMVAAIRKAAQTLGQIALDPEIGEPDASSLSVVRGEHRTRLVAEPANGRLPYTPEADAASKLRRVEFTRQTFGQSSEGPETRLSWERCLAGMGQAPLLTTWAIAMNRRVVQTPDALVVWSEAGGETRIVRIGGEHAPTVQTSFIGDSIGRWEGETLVVETTHMRADDPWRLLAEGRPVAVGANSRVIERFTRVSPDELLYQFTVEDPALYAAPWMAEYVMRPSTEQAYEFACHEGNYALPNILRGAREGEIRQASAPPATASPNR
jgi:hypothetical protein